MRWFIWFLYLLLKCALCDLTASLAQPAEKTQKIDNLRIGDSTIRPAVLPASPAPPALSLISRNMVVSQLAFTPPLPKKRQKNRYFEKSPFCTFSWFSVIKPASLHASPARLAVTPYQLAVSTPSLPVTTLPTSRYTLPSSRKNLDSRSQNWNTGYNPPYLIASRFFLRFFSNQV